MSEITDHHLLKRLTPAESRVASCLVEGLSNKEIALNLKISPRTVETYRAWVMEKTGARNIADLVRIAMRLEESELPARLQ